MKSAGDVFIIFIYLFFWRIVYSFSDNITMINISLCTKNKVRLLLRFLQTELSNCELHLQTM